MQFLHTLRFVGILQIITFIAVLVYAVFAWFRKPTERKASACQDIPPKTLRLLPRDSQEASRSELELPLLQGGEESSKQEFTRVPASTRDADLKAKSQVSGRNQGGVGEPCSVHQITSK
jgi:hypothetical protein